MKISVITICYNAVDPLRTTIESVNEQSYADVEHIIVDGGSSDGSAQLARTLATRQPKLISEKDKGIADAFNKGTRLATGDYVCYLNAGDVFAAPHTVADVMQRIAKGGEAAAAVYFGDFICVTDDDGEFITKASAEPRGFEKSNPINHQSVLIPRTVAEAFPYDESLKIGMDYDLWLRIQRAGIPFIHLQTVVARFAVNGRSSDPRWAVHNFVVRRMLWLKYSGQRIDLPKVFEVFRGAVLLRTKYILRGLAGRRVIRSLKRLGIRKSSRFTKVNVR